MVYMPCYALMLLLNDTRYPFPSISLYISTSTRNPFFTRSASSRALFLFRDDLLHNFRLIYALVTKYSVVLKRCRSSKLQYYQKMRSKFEKSSKNIKTVKFDKITASTKNIILFLNVTFEIWKIFQFKSLFTPRCNWTSIFKKINIFRLL